MDSLDRYLVRDFLLYFICILLGLSSLFLGIDFLTKFWDIKLPTNSIFLLYLFKIPETAQLFFPFACLLGTLLVVSQMSQSNELLALFSGGVAPFRIISCFVSVVALLCTFAFIFFEATVPSYKKKQILVEQGKDPNSELEMNLSGGDLWYRNGKSFFQIGRVSQENGKLEDVHVYQLDHQFEMLRKIKAKVALFEQGDWVLKDGFSVNYFQESHFPVTQEFKQEQGMNLGNPKEFQTTLDLIQTFKLKDLRKLIRRRHSLGLETDSESAYYHERIASIFTPLIFILLSIPFVVKPLRTHSMAKSIGFCFMVILAYKIIFGVVMATGKAGHLPPLIAGWATNVVFLGYAIFRIALAK